MSIDRSLKSGTGMTKHRNVLSRTERIAKLTAKDDFSMEDGDPLGLPKVANRKVTASKTAKKVKTEETAETAEGETPETDS